MFIRLILFSIFILSACSPQDHFADKTKNKTLPNQPYLVVLGIAQDAGFPQIGCKKKCCLAIEEQKAKKKMVSCLALVDPKTQEKWLFDCTPDFKNQLKHLDKITNEKQTIKLSGIFLTHAHMGHYTGLIHLGREATGAKEIPVYAMPRMKTFLENNGPWSQLVNLKNIQLKSLKADSVFQLNSQISVVPFLVPHRDEFSETVGFKILTKEQSLLFIPDIDKWQKWNRSIVEEIKAVDYAFLDGTFFENGEIPNRDMSEIPHPFISESLALFETLPTKEKAKIHFIHFNHSNPILQKNSTAQQKVLNAGFKIAKEFQVIGL